MKLFIVPRSWRLPIISAVVLFASGNTQAAVSLSCSTPSATNINFGTINGLATSATSTGTVSWTCQNTGTTTTYVTFCLNIGDGSAGVTGTTRQMTGGTSTLQFQLYQNAANTQVWGSELSGANTTPYQVQFPVPRRGSYTGSATVYGAVPGGQVGVVPGNFSSSFSTVNSAISGTYTLSGSSYPANCGGSNSGLYFPFTVTASVIKQCLVSAGSSIDLGSVPSTQTNISGTNNISVSCTNATPYFIGMLPSNGNTGGIGVMTGTQGGTVPYQLYSNPGLTTVWGDTATSTSVGNGVAGMGSGSAQTIPVWAKAPSANYVPDSYTDTVTINVNY